MIVIRKFPPLSQWPPGRLRLAVLLSFAIHLVLIGLARYRLSFDAYVHMFFGDHYRRWWWDLWETRWYTGFSVSSYPPLVHQLIGLLSHAIGVEAAFMLALLAVLTALPLAVYAFARVFVGPAAAGYAALLSALLPSIYLAAHTFGQLPTIAGLLCTLLALAVLAEWLQTGRWLTGALAVALMAVVAAAHHGTLLFAPWGALAIGLHLALKRRAAFKPLALRLALWGLATGASAILVIWPFWWWGLGQSLQTPIDHVSRHNFLLEPQATILFFWPMYGPLVLLIPWALRLSWSRRHLALGGLFALMFLLGLGGTTPLPQWLFGANWAWLTYDRFALWASVSLLPFAGQWMVWSRQKFKVSTKKRSNIIASERAGGLYPPVRALTTGRLSAIARLVLLAALASLALLNVLLSTILPTQPPAVDLQPIVNFLAEGDRSRWRYLTFGFGDQIVRLPILTEATTLDGSYHTARPLPELRQSGIGQIDTAYWAPNGLQALDSILARSGMYGTRWGFVILAAYEPLLERHGWVYQATLSNGVRVWENPSAIPPTDPAAQSDPLQAISWGMLPLAALGITVVLATLHQIRFVSSYERNP